MPVIEPQVRPRVQSDGTTVRSTAPARSARKTQKHDPVRRVSTKDLSRLARQLSTLLHAGMPLVPALSALVEQMQSPPKSRGVRWGHSVEPLAPIVEQVRDDVNGGSSLAEALGRHPNLFSTLFVNMVAAGEASGALEAVLARLADILEKRVQLTGKVKAAIAYPVMMAAVAVAVVMFLLSYVVPSISELFVKMNQDLPLPTQILIGISGFARAHGVLIIVGLAGIVTAMIGVSRTQDGRIWTDRIKLALPLFGPLFFKLEVARLSRTLGTLMKSGIPVITAMEISQRISQNRLIADATGQIKDWVHKGETIANAFRATGMFPPVVFHVIQTGQMAGNVEDGLLDIADMYDGEVETTVRTLTALLEPMILLLMGGVVGFIVLSILLPIFEINQAL